MVQTGCDLPETFLGVIKEDREYSIFLLEGEKLILFPARPEGEWNIGDVHNSAHHRRATDAELDFYFRQIAPEADWRETRLKLWRSVDPLGVEGSSQKARAIEARIVGCGCSL